MTLRRIELSVITHVTIASFMLAPQSIPMLIIAIVMYNFIGNESRTRRIFRIWLYTFIAGTAWTAWIDYLINAPRNYYIP